MGNADLRGVNVWAGSLNLLVGPDSFCRTADADKRMLEVTGSEYMFNQFTDRDLEFLFQLRNFPQQFLGQLANRLPCLLCFDIMGRTKGCCAAFPGGNHETLIEMIKTKLINLPGKTKVYSGHGPETTIAAEKKSNPFLQ